MNFIPPVDVISGLLVLLIAWVSGLPQRFMRYCIDKVRYIGAQRNLAAGSIDKETLRQALQYYVRPKFSNVDPSQDAEPLHALVNARDDLFRMTDRFLRTDYLRKKHLLILADSGMGKTSFLLNYFQRNYRLLRVRRQRIQFVSLAQDNPERFIDSVPLYERKDTNLFLDALDEDTKAVGRAEDRLLELLRIADAYRTVIVTCRTQFFRSDSHIPTTTGIAKIGVVPANAAKHYEFARVYLSPFDNRQIRAYLRRRFSGAWQVLRRFRARKIVEKIPSLSVRPMLLAHMPEILDSRTQVRKPVDVYEAMVAAWCTRESRWIGPSSLWRISEMLALDIYLNRADRGSETVAMKDLQRLVKSWGVSLDDDRLTSRSLLNRTSDGRWKFAHRSIMEYFVAEYIVGGGASGLAISLTDQMARFVCQRIGCESDALESFIGGCDIHVSILEPELRIGHPCNDGIYVPIPVRVDAEGLDKLKVRFVEGWAPSSTLGGLIEDFARSAQAQGSIAKSVRLSISNLMDSRGFTRGYLAVNVNSLWVMHWMEMETKAIRELVEIDHRLRGEFLLVRSGIGTGEWEVRVRVDLGDLDARSWLDLRAMYNNPAVGFQFNSLENLLEVKILDGFVTEVGALSPFGILDHVRLTPVAQRPYAVLGPVRVRLH